MAVRPSRSVPRIADPSSQPAVADVLGAILLVGLTVGMTVVLALLLMTYQGPQQVPHARLSITASPGTDGAWDTDDDTIRVEHLGGDTLAEGTRVLIRVGSVTTDLSGAALGDAFSDGRLVVGETWSHSMRIPPGLIGVDVVGHGEASTILASAALVAAPVGGP